MGNELAADFRNISSTAKPAIAATIHRLPVRLAFPALGSAWFS